MLQQQQEQESSSQKQTEGWVPFRKTCTQPQMAAKQVAELEEERDMAYQQVNSYKTQTEKCKKELEVEKKKTSELEKQLESSRTNPVPSPMVSDAERKVSTCKTYFILS